MDMKCMSQSTKKRIRPNTANPCMASSSRAIAGGKSSACWCRSHGGSGSSGLARRTSGELIAGARWDGSDELCWIGSRPPGSRQGKLVPVPGFSHIDVRRAATVWWCRMFQPTAQDSRVCRSPDLAAKSADEAGGAAGQTLSLVAIKQGQVVTTSAFKVNALFLFFVR